MVPISILDLVPVIVGETHREALPKSLELAQHAERLGYTRFWVAEHHNMPGIASAATAVVIGYLASGTTTIRVGSGGIMLPNHAPLVIAEQFGTLASLYPGRIDLGLGRAAGGGRRGGGGGGGGGGGWCVVCCFVGFFFFWGRNWRRRWACRMPSRRTSR